MKKLLLLLLVVILWALGYLYFTDRLSLLGLKSDAINVDECSSEFITEKSETYKQALIQRQQHLNEINAITSEASGTEVTPQVAAEQLLVPDLQKKVDSLSMIIDNYEACKQSLIIQWIIPGEGALTSGEVIISGEVTPEVTPEVVTETATVTNDSQTGVVETASSADANWSSEGGI